MGSELAKKAYRLCLSALLLVVAQPLTAADKPNAKAWLDTMSFALKQLNYEGTFVYRRGPELAALHVSHTISAAGEQEVISTLTGEARQITRSSSQFQVFGSSNGEDGGLSKNLERSYELSLGHVDRVAGRKAQLLNVMPRDKYRYGYRLWLDIETGLLLRSDLFDHESHILEQVMFTSLEVKGSEAEAEGEASSNEAPASDSEAQQALLSGRWQVGGIPVGFEVVTVKLPEQNRGVEHMIYSDGLASVSIFVEKRADEAEPFVGVSHMGAVNAFGVLTEGYSVTVVGEVPEATVIMIGESMKLVGR